MPKFNDLTNKRFGKLLVIKTNEKKNGAWQWLCKCDCGNLKTIRGTSLTNGSTKSCGCSMGHRIISDNRDDVLLRREYNKVRNRHNKNKFIGELFNFDVFKTLSISKCYYCGLSDSKVLKERKSNKKEQERISDFVLKVNGIDRVDSSIGYTNENSVSCCKDCNFAKNDRSKEEFLTWLKDIYKYNEDKILKLAKIKES